MGKNFGLGGRTSVWISFDLGMSGKRTIKIPKDWPDLTYMNVIMAKQVFFTERFELDSKGQVVIYLEFISTQQ